MTQNTSVNTQQPISAFYCYTTKNKYSQKLDEKFIPGMETHCQQLTA
jgi:hypothetical protein